MTQPSIPLLLYLPDLLVYLSPWQSDPPCYDPANAFLKMVLEILLSFLGDPLCPFDCVVSSLSQIQFGVSSVHMHNGELDSEEETQLPSVEHRPPFHLTTPSPPFPVQH